MRTLARYRANSKLIPSGLSLAPTTRSGSNIGIFFANSESRLSMFEEGVVFSSLLLVSSDSTKELTAASSRPSFTGRRTTRSPSGPPPASGSSKPSSISFASSSSSSDTEERSCSWRGAGDEVLEEEGGDLRRGREEKDRIGRWAKDLGMRLGLGLGFGEEGEGKRGNWDLGEEKSCIAPLLTLSASLVGHWIKRHGGGAKRRASGSHEFSRLNYFCAVNFRTCDGLQRLLPRVLKRYEGFFGHMEILRGFVEEVEN
ncbi:hypothetical protein BHE74_00005108 [Ensete ventricosum]|nr:hypothetical protein BHE74_00005108 [Ensete ventricosum]RZR80543.1 hypothetical protein BHM03_00006590 [Ensete ventricosum]